MLTVERLRQVLHYDPVTGNLTWLVSTSNRAPVGSVAGCRDPRSGYVLLRIDGTLYFAHRLAWFYMTGVWPADLLDHRNLIRSDNRWENLREATYSQNFQNSGRRKDNTSGIKGVSWDAQRGLWRAQICVEGKRMVLGRFASKDSAAAAYSNAANQYFGEFARVA